MQLWRPALVGAICASYALYCLRTMPGPISAPDSAGYLAFAPIHVLGYPLFLRVLGAKGATIAQPLLFAGALACLGVETLQLTSSITLTIAVVTAPMFVPGLTTYHASVLTESLFMSGLIAFLASMIAFVRSPSPRSAAAAAVTAALTAAMRRTGLALLPIIAIMVLLEWRRLPRARAAIVAAIVPVVTLVGAERMAARAIHGDRVATEAGRHLYAKAAMIEAPRPAHLSSDAARAALEDHLAVMYIPIRDLVRRAPPDVASVLALYYEGCLQGPCVPELGLSVTGSESAQLNDDLVRVALERIGRAPLNFLTFTAQDYRSLWVVYRLRHPETAQALAAFIAANRPLPFERDDPMALAPESMPTYQPSEAARVAQWIITGAGWLTGGLALIGLAAAASRRTLPRGLSVACLAALTAHGGLLFTVLLAAGLSRFMIGLWPAVTTAVLFGGWWASRRVLDSRRRSSRPAPALS